MNKAFERPAPLSTESGNDEAVTTLALLMRKNGMSRELFSRYWRDVHGVLAARIPGFESYVQYHLGEPFDNILPPEALGIGRVPGTARFDGFAEVSFQNAAKRVGLATSEVAGLIQQDEQNVFRTSLLFNLEEGASNTVVNESAVARSSALVLLGGLPDGTPDVVPASVDALLLRPLRAMKGLCRLRVHALRSGEQQSWQTEGVDNEQTADTTFDVIVQLDFSGALRAQELRQAFAAVPPPLYQVISRLHVYPVRERHVMVDSGRPTELGLRGLDVQRTIAAVGAANQRSEAVLRCVFGDSAFGAP